jgi:hypothetical protein
MKKIIKPFVILVGALLGIWVLVEIVMRLYLEAPLQTDFYSSLPRQDVIQRQEQYGVQAASGPGWAHLGWIADPERESCRVVSLKRGEPEQDTWYITTAGWPWVTTLTSSEVAIAPLKWEPY